MATVQHFLQSPADFFEELQIANDVALGRCLKKFLAVRTLQRFARGYLVRKHFAWLYYNAVVIQCAWRKYCAKKAFQRALEEAAKRKHDAFYNKNATIIQALWRGYHSRRHNFNYYAYRNWLRTVTERGKRKADEIAEFKIKSRIDNLKILEEEAQQWLAFVAFKLHHLLRTRVVAGVYSKPGTHELSQFEKLLSSIKYTEYMKRLKKKYDEFVRKHKQKFSNKRLFPVIGEGYDYWYLTLPEMYELTYEKPLENKSTRHLDTHHGDIHNKPFLWRKVDCPRDFEGRGPFKAVQKISKKFPPAPAPTPDDVEPRKDPRFHLYVKYYKPQPDVMEYVDFHINCLLKRKNSILNTSPLKEDKFVLHAKSRSFAKYPKCSSTFIDEFSRI